MQEFVNHGVLCGNMVNYGLLHGNPDHKYPWYWKGRRFGGCVVVSEQELLTCYLRSHFGMGAIDLISACFALKQDINADL